jgi:hypothetical protein
MVFVLCAGIADPVCCAESQQQEFKFESVHGTDPSAEDEWATGFLQGLIAKRFQLYFSPKLTARLSPVIGSDAYPGIILHGPPSPDHSA